MIPRTTVIEAHEHVVATLPGNLDLLCSLPCISKLTIWTREAEPIFEKNKSFPSAALYQLWYATWSSE